MSSLTLFVGNENYLKLAGLINNVTGLYVNDASVSIQLKDRSGTNVGTSTAMSYIAASNGDYAVTLADSLGITAGKGYVAHVDAEAPGGLTYHAEEPVVAKIRKS